MTNNLANPLEELEKIPSDVVGQLVKLPGSLLGQAVKQILPGGGTKSSGKIDPLTGLEIPSKKQFQQLQKREKKQRQSGLAMMRQTINATRQQSNNATKSDVSQLPAYIAGKPGFSSDKMIKRMEGIETEKHELPPPVASVKQKFSTGERKHGVGG